MPNRCSVANCTSNYDGTQYTPVFEMLNHWSKDTQEEWRKFLHREDAWELARVFICANHFGDDDLLLHFEKPQHDGTVEKVPRKPGLRKNTKPIYLPNCPSYLQRSSEHAERFDRNVIDVRHFQKALELSLAESKTENEKFSVSNIEEIEQKHSILNLAQKWFYFRSGQTTLNVFKRILSGHLLIMSHQIHIYGCDKD